MKSKIENLEDEVICQANLKSFKVRVNQLKHLIADRKDLEGALVDLCEEMLVSHGKNKEQVRQISQISRILGESLGLGKTYCEKLEQAARIYDIGNLLVCSEIYMKDDELSFEEFNIIKNHTLWGYNLLIAQHFEITDLGAVISAEHHEWWNAEGYPRGISGKEIDIAARVVSLADSVGALFTKRPGRVAWEYDRIVKYVQGRKGIEFDPAVVDVFMINKDVIYKVLRTDLSTIESKWYA